MMKGLLLTRLLVFTGILFIIHLGEQSVYAEHSSPLPLDRAPARPDNLSVGNPTTSSLRLTWNDRSKNETGFEIERTRTSGGPYTLIHTTLANVTGYTDTGLSEGTRYFYRIRAIAEGDDDDGDDDDDDDDDDDSDKKTQDKQSPWTAEASGTTLSGVPQAPSSFKGTATGVCTVQLTWSDNSDNEEGFQITRSLSASGDFSQIASLDPRVNSYTDRETENNRTYYYRITAFNSSGASSAAAASVEIDVDLRGGMIGPDQDMCPSGEPARIRNITSPSGGNGNWNYRWQSRTVQSSSFSDINGAASPEFDPPAGLTLTTEYRRISTAECGSVISNITTISIEDTEEPVFTSCPADIKVNTDQDQPSATVTTPHPKVSDNCDVVLQTWTLSGATTGKSAGNGINNVGTHSFNPGLTKVTYYVEDRSGNSASCSFDVTVKPKIPVVSGVSIPNTPMKIGDVITATIDVMNDAGSKYDLASGSIGGYPLISSSFTRKNATTYQAEFKVTDGGNSYSSGEDIPVSGLVISEGTRRSLSYNGSISQSNDPIDAERPVVLSLQAEAGDKRVGDQVILNISADGNNYSAHTNTSINGVPLKAERVTFTASENNIYVLKYIVSEGDPDVDPGKLEAQVILVDPSGNVSEEYTFVENTDHLTIDANSPVIYNLEVPDMEVGVGGEVRITVSADQDGYMAVGGTTVNGIPLDSPRLEFEDNGNGVYLLTYLVEEGDPGTRPGGLEVSLVLSDHAGNLNTPYTQLEDNQLEVYTELPTAVLEGTNTICEGEEAEMQLVLSGRPPWTCQISDGSSLQEFTGIQESTYRFMVTPGASTIYSISNLMDRNGVMNEGSGNLQVTVNEKTDVKIINLAPGYHVNADPILLEANMMGGIFSGPGVTSTTGYFDPGLADTVNSPHTIFYTYTNAGGCTSIDSARVFVNSWSNRMSILEYFTNSADQASLSADNAVDRFMEGNRGNILDLHYHMSYPDFDPMNFNNPDPAATRAITLGVGQVPFATLDGGVSPHQRYDFSGPDRMPNADHMKVFALEELRFDIELEVDWMESGLNATVNIDCRTDSFPGNLQLYVVVFESLVTTYTGMNGDTLFRNVVLDMLPTPAGKMLGSWSQEKSEIRRFKWNYAPYVEDVEDLAVVVFIQDRSSGRILQAAVEYQTPLVGTADEIMPGERLQVYPNPAGELISVHFGTETVQEGVVRIINMNGVFVQSNVVSPGQRVITLGIGTLDRGMYIIQWIEAGQLRAWTKLVRAE